jgi:hypothetical protein
VVAALTVVVTQVEVLAVVVVAVVVVHTVVGTLKRGGPRCPPWWTS